MNFGKHNAKNPVVGQKIKTASASEANDIKVLNNLIDSQSQNKIKTILNYDVEYIYNSKEKEEIFNALPTYAQNNIVFDEIKEEGEFFCWAAYLPKALRDQYLPKTY